MEIEVGKYGLEQNTKGMYARTTSGIIGIIVNANSDEMLNGPEIRANEKIYCVERDSIKKVKHNIIDLIEVGDYVNEYEVIETDLENEVDNQICVSTPTVKELYLLNSDIETIVTHEQFSSIEYKVEEDK